MISKSLWWESRALVLAFPKLAFPKLACSEGSELAASSEGGSQAYGFFRGIREKEAAVFFCATYKSGPI